MQDKHLRTYFLIFFFLILALPSLVWADPDDQKEQEVVQETAKQRGRIVPSNYLPELSKDLSSLMQRLHDASKPITGDRLEASHIHVIESEEDVAMVHLMETSTKGHFRNVVFVSTGLLRRMYENEKGQIIPEETGAGTVRLAGILSHELAHAFDTLDKEGFGQRNPFGQTMYSQVREIRADSEAIEILRRARLPRDGLYQGLIRVLGKGADRSRVADAVMSAIRSHPEDDARLAAHRILLTLDRYKRGDPEIPVPKPMPKEAFTDLNKILAVNSSPDWLTVPGSIEKVISELQTFKKSNAYQHEPPPEQVKRFNHLLLSLDRMLEQKGLNLSKPEFDALLNFNKDFIGSSIYPARYNQEQLKSTGLSDIHPRTHLENVERIPIYRHPAYQNFLKESMSQSGVTIKDGNFLILDWMKEIAPDSVVTSTFRSDIAQGLRSERQNGTISGDSNFHQSELAELKARVGQIYFRDVLSKHDLPSAMHDFLRFDLVGNYDQRQPTSYLFLRYSLPPGASPELKAATLRNFKEELASVQDPTLKTDIKAMAQFMWDRRAGFGLLDILLPGELHTNWDFIYEQLGIDPKAGREELVKSIKEYTSTDNYANFFLKNLKAIGAKEPELLGITRREENEGKLNPHADFRRGNVPWADSSLLPYLAGEHCQAVRTNPELEAIAKFRVAGTLLSSNKEEFRRAYGKALTAELAKIPSSKMNATHFEEAHRKALVEISGSDGKQGIPTTLSDIQAETIEKSNLPAEQKQNILKQLFVFDFKKGDPIITDRYPLPGLWMLHNQHGANRRVLEVLVRSGNKTSPSEALSEMGMDKSLGDGERGFAYIAAIEHFEKPLREELEAIANSKLSTGLKLKQLEGFVKKAIDPYHGDYKNNNGFHAAGSGFLAIDRLKDRAAEILRDLPVHPAEKLKLLAQMTGSGATPTTDKVFETVIEPQLLPALKAGHINQVTNAAALPEGAGTIRFNSAKVRLRFTKALFEPPLRHLEGSPVSAELLKGLLKTINDKAPEKSASKDEFLESISWRLGIEDPHLLEMVEKEKSFSWRNRSGLAINLISFFSTYVRRFTPEERKLAIDYFLNPRAGIPKGIKDAIDRFASEDIKSISDEADPEKLRNKKDGIVRGALNSLESLAHESGQQERIPIFELLVHGGNNPLLTNPETGRKLAQEHLGYKPGSKEDKIFAAFLKVIPEHERGTTLAHLLSLKGQEEGGVKAIFEVFQTVGIKGGQFASIWKILGPELTRELAELKDNASPLSKLEIRKFLDATLSPEERGRVKRIKKILGSASLKTVALLELNDGREVVAVIMRPHAEENVSTNLNLAKRFLAELKAEGISTHSSLLEPLIGALERQLGGELDLTQEADKIRRAKKVYEKWNKELHSELGNWKFDVPGVVEDFGVRKNLLFLEHAKGVSFDRLAKTAQSQVGSPIAKSAIMGLFREGWFNADGHARNYLIDENSHTISPIDFGQEVLFDVGGASVADDRYKLANFLAALSTENPEAIRKAGLSLRDASNEKNPISPNLNHSLEEAIKAPGSPTDKIIKIVEAFGDNGVHFKDQFTFGAIKGMMTLHGEQYVDNESLSAVLKDEVQKLLTQKLPVMLSDEASFLKSCGGIMGFLGGMKSAK